MSSFLAIWGATYAFLMFIWVEYLMIQNPIDYQRVMMDLLAAIFGVLVYIAARQR